MHATSRAQRPSLPLLPVALVLALVPAAGAAQGSEGAFTVDDLLDVERVRLVDLSADGRWAVVSMSSLRDRLGRDNHRYGDPTYVAPAGGTVVLVDTRTGARISFPRDASVREAVLSPDGTRVAALVHDGERFGVEVLRRGGGVLERVATVALPGGRTVAGQGAPLRWSPDGDALYVPARDPGWKAEAESEFRRLTEGPVVVQSSDEDFLAWEALRRRSRLQSLHAWHPGDGSSREVIAETMLADYRVLPDGRLVWEDDTTEETSYARIFGTRERVRLLDPVTGDERTLIESTEEVRPRWSRRAGHYAFVRDGDVFVASVDDEEPTRLTRSGEGEADEEEGAAAASAPGGDEDEGSWSVLSVGPGGERVLATRQGDWYLLEPGDDEPRLVLDRPDEDSVPRRPSWSVEGWAPDGDAAYLTREARDAWRRSVVRLDLEEGTTTDLLVTDRLLEGVTVSEDGGTVLYQTAPGNRPLDLWAADPRLADPRRLTDANPDLDGGALARTELFSYLDVDGRELYGVVYYPPDYVEGRRWPTVFHVYEDFFDDDFNGTVNLLASHGYVVVRPSVHLERGYPGEAWMKGVTAAANELIRRGVADPDRLGVHGTSYGGYAVNLLVTQTDRFAAAINISGKVDMISFYTDSPRLGVRNIHAPERSQDRIGATLWEQPQKYVAHSAIMFADRIDTPLLLLTGEQDHNVPARTTMEMFYALRRLGKTVEWATYVDGGHGMPTTDAAMVRDYHDRILGWYDRWLKGEAAKDDRVGG